jgi:hypothetical protein
MWNQKLTYMLKILSGDDLINQTVLVYIYGNVVNDADRRKNLINI